MKKRRRTKKKYKREKETETEVMTMVGSDGCDKRESIVKEYKTK